MHLRGTKAFFCRLAAAQKSALISIASGAAGLGRKRNFDQAKLFAIW
jgi:hypothetical protein